MLGQTNTYKNITKVSELINDANYIQDDVVSDGVYAVAADGSLIDYNSADAAAIGVALVAGEHKFMIAKSDATNNGSNYNLLWTNNTSDLSLTNYNKVDGTNSFGYLPKPDGTFGGSTHLSDDFTTWTNGALSDFNGKDNTAVIAAASSEAIDMCTVLNTFNASDSFKDWYVPACGQLALMYLNMTEINAALAKIGGTALAAEIYWSSSENSSNFAWFVSFSNGFVRGYGKYNGNQVRFVRDISTFKLLKERVIELEQSIPTKVSQLENDKNYIENGDGYNSGVYIALQSGKLINPDEYDSTTETAVGVAVIDLTASFIIGLNHTDSIPWGTSDQGLYKVDISGLTNYSDSTAAATDTNGVANTNTITAIYSGTDCAAGLAKSQSITYGNNSLTGYLGSAGEWQIVLNNYEAVKSAIVTAEGNCFQATYSLCYQTSTEYDSTYAWYAYCNPNGWYLNYYSKSNSTNQYCVVPFYKIDNETTVLSKINLITTPAGSSTAPIYINSSGFITPSSTYAGGTAVTLNGYSKGGSTASFYAPTSAGTSGYVLTSTGGSTPSWAQKMPIIYKSGSFTALMGCYYNVYLNGNYTITVPSVGSSAEEINFQINTDGNSRSISFVDSNGEELTKISNEDFTALSANTRYLASVSADNVILINAGEDTIPKITLSMQITSINTSSNHLYVDGRIVASQVPSSNITLDIDLTYYSATKGASVYPYANVIFPAGTTQYQFSVSDYSYRASDYTDWTKRANDSYCSNKGFYKGMYIIDNLDLA